MTEVLLEACSLVFQPMCLLYLLIGCVCGLVIGVLPGLGPVFGVALFLPFTYGMEPVNALIMLVGIQASCAYGDGLTAIILNIPGGPGGIANMFDGYPLTKQGRAGEAVGLVAGSSIFGSLVGLFCLVFFGEALANYAIKLHPADYFMLSFFGLTMVALIGGEKKAIKGLILGCMGLMLAFIGRDATTGCLRFTLGSAYLEDGLPFIPCCLGLFALAQVMQMTEDGHAIAGDMPLITKPWGGVAAAFKNWFCALRGSLVGVFFAACPGIGITTASMMSYIAETRCAKAEDRPSYGKGNIRGVIAPQAAANATVGGELIPALSLGIPGGPTSAIFLSALTLHGLEPGLNFYSEGGSMAYAIMVGLFLTTWIFFVLGISLTPLLAKLTKIPFELLIPMIIILSFTGCFAVRGRVSDMILAIVFAVFGYIINKLNWPTTSMILGMVLAALVENNFNRATMLSGGSLAVFVQKPVSLIFFLAVVITTLFTYVIGPLRRRKKAKT